MDKKSLIKIAETIILHYVKGKYFDRSNIEEEIIRIQEICNSLDVSIKSRVSEVNGENRNGKIIIFFGDKEKPTEKEIINALGVLIHEIYHSISKREKGNEFLEEGYVTYMTAETIRYAIDNPIEIPGVITADELKRLLEHQDLINGYNEASEIFRSTQLLMQQHAIDSAYEYMFNGIESLMECSVRISFELESILKLQENKHIHSQTLSVEKCFFRKAFEQIDFSDISPTLVEMNRMLQSYLIESGEINQNRRVYDLVKKFNLETIAHMEFCEECEGLSDDEIANLIGKKLPQDSIKYQIYDDMPNTIEQMKAIEKIYRDSSSPIKPATFSQIRFYAILIAYDLLQKGIEEPSKENIILYCNYIIFNPNDVKLMVAQVLNYIKYVEAKSEEGKDLNDILNEGLINSAIFNINLRRISGKEEPFWDKVNKVTALARNQSTYNGEFFWIEYYRELCKMYKKILDEEHIYDELDYEAFVSQMQSIFNSANFPGVMSETGYTPEAMFVEMITENLDLNLKNFPIQVIKLLRIINNRDPNLGSGTGRFDNFGLAISRAYENLQKSSNTEDLRVFGENLTIACYNRQYSSKFCLAMGKSFGNRIFRNNNVENTAQCIIENPEFYKDLNAIRDMFEKCPEVARIIMGNQNVLEMITEQLPDEVKIHFKEHIESINERFGMCGISMSDIDSVILKYYLGKSFTIYEKDDFNSEKFKQLSPLVKFFIQYNQYLRLLSSRDREKIKEFFPKGIIISEEREKVLKPQVLNVMAESPEVQSCQHAAREVLSDICSFEKSSLVYEK